MCIFVGNDKYQFNGPPMDHFMVNMREISYTCRVWEVIGIPCKHGVAIIFDMLDYGLEVGAPKTWVHLCYWLKIWKLMYSYKIEPINERIMLPHPTIPLLWLHQTIIDRYNTFQFSCKLLIYISILLISIPV